MKFLAMVKDVGKNWESQIKENNNIKCFGITKDTRVYSRNAEHAVTVIGYGLWKKPHEDCQKLFISSRNNSDPSSAGYYSVADSIPFIVVHDDQTGPYVRCVVREDNHGFLLSETPDLCRVSAGNIPKGFFHYHIANVLDSSIKITDEQLPEEEQTYRSVPELLLMGLHPKIRLHLQSVEALVVHFETMLSKLVMETSLRNDALGYELLGILQHGNTESISGKKSDRIIHYLWDIYLDRNTEMKYELRKQFHADERPVNDDGMEVLEQRWPLFVWRACARDASGRVFDIFFDATHSLSDNMVIQILIYRKKIDSFVKPFFHSIVGTTDNELYHLWSESIIFLHWMKQIIPNIHGHAHEETLSEKFGHLHLPSHLKAWEQDANGLCKSFNDDERLIFHDTNAKDWTEPGKMLFKWLTDGKGSATFIWLIDGHGRLIIGKERPVDQQHPNDMLGHPALVAGGRARIAGELKWDEQTNSFQVNNRSGRYTKKSVDREESHLNTVVGWMNRIAEICQSNRKFFKAFDKDYGADLINSIFDLRKEISEILDIPGSNLRRSGEELGRKLAFSGAMMDKINEALSLANQWDPTTDRTRVKTILSHALAPWLEQCQPQNLDETLLRQLQLTLSDWFSAGDVDLSNATLEVFVIIHSISPQSNQMVRNTLEHYAREHAFSLDAQNPTLMRIRQFLVNSKIASS
ncbi:MAG: hypothetical protein HQL84_11410 [Magnetococcales bacterium]|nr:hypothetical protein [Magnetococcales bacterium]MBF0150642.1 hypothetical protein [Magnetococcales bacterium]